MTYNDPYNPRPQRPPDVDPVPLGSNPPRYRDVNRTGDWDMGIIIAAVAALIIAAGLTMWAGPTDQQTANNPPATTGQGGQVPPRIAR